MSTTLQQMIRKRHDGPAWIVFSELADATGGTCSRHADMAALGLWPSHGQKLIGYEMKHSRGDVQKELKDPRKADAVGKFCDEWWLVISDVAIIDGLVLPETWGVLAPKNQVLRVVRKAPTLKPKPITRGFVGAMIRNVTSSWVPRATHSAMLEDAHQKLTTKLVEERSNGIADTKEQLDSLRKVVATFEEASGVKIDRWNGGNVGEAVKILTAMRHDHGDAANRRRIQELERTAEQFEHTATTAKNAATTLKQLIAEGST